MTYIPEHNEINNSIVSEFQLSEDAIEQMKEAVKALTESRMEICKLFKIPRFNAKNLYEDEKELIRKISFSKSNIQDYEKKQIELKDKIKANKIEVKVIKLHINNLEDKLRHEQQESKKFRVDLGIFICKEKFKFIKKLFVRKYRKVFMKYNNELSIKTKILECNNRKEEIRKEKENLNISLDRYNKKIIINKIALAEMRKSIINAQKSIDFLLIKLENIRAYKEMERKFKLEVLRIMKS